MGYQQRKFIDCKILFGKEFTFSDRVDFVTRLLSDKNLSAFIGHKHMRVFYLNEYGIEEDIGYITEEMLGEDFYRWLYTAFTRATGQLYLVNLPKAFETD